MKKILFLSFVIILAGCSSVTPEFRKITKRSLKSETTYTPNLITTQSNQIEINIEPISPSILGTRLKHLSTLSGDFFFEYNDNQIMAVEKTKVFNILQRKDIEKSVKDLCESINKSNSYQQEILLKILNHYNLNNDISDDNNNIAHFNNNPFEIGDKVLSVFKITLNNLSSNEEIFDVSDIHMYCNNEQLLPLPAIFFDNFKMSNTSKLLLDRIYLINPTIIKPNQLVTKYFATHPIDDTNDKLDIYVNNDKFTINMEKNIEVINEEEEYRLLKFNPLIKGKMFPINSTTGKAYSLLNGKIFIPTKQKTSNVDVVIFDYNAQKNEFWVSIRQNLGIKGNQLNVK